MFFDFFFLLRAQNLKVTLTEWMTLMEALSVGLGESSLVTFYHLCRAICIKNEGYFDLYDQCFAHYFRDAKAPESVLDEVMKWLENPIMPRELSDEERAQLKALDLDELRRQFEERLKEQKERHDGGSHWVGTGGRSPFGHGGTNPGGVRVGGEGGGRSAMQIASARRFRNLRKDLTIDTRQMGVALKQLRRLARTGRPEELDLEGTIDHTARNAGDIELVFAPERKNTVKLLLLMDVGGSMTPYSVLCSQLFSAAHASTHFKSFKSYYFHNCPYGSLFADMERYDATPTDQLLQDLDRDWFCIIVGDAAMHPYELTSAGGAIDYWHRNDESGLRWLQKIRERFPRSAWLNPDPERYWGIPSTRIIRQVFEMFPFTLKGLEQTIAHLRSVPL